MPYEQILVARTGRVAVITLNRPETLNATTDVMNRELQDAFRTTGEDASVGCVVLTGAGRAFCAGADVRAFQSGLAGGPGYRASHGPDKTWIQIDLPNVYMEMNVISHIRDGKYSDRELLPESPNDLLGTPHVFLT